MPPKKSPHDSASTCTKATEKSDIRRREGAARCASFCAEEIEALAFRLYILQNTGGGRMSAGIYNIPKIEQGARYELEIFAKDELGAFIDLTGATFDGQVRNSTSDADVQATFSFAIDPDQVTNKGRVLAYIPDTVTALMDIPACGNGKRGTLKAVYDISYQFSPGNKKRLLEGTAQLVAEASKI